MCGMASLIAKPSTLCKTLQNASSASRHSCRGKTHTFRHNKTRTAAHNVVYAAEVEDKAVETAAEEVIEDAYPSNEWAQQQLAELDVIEEQPPPPEYRLNFLWLDKNIAVSVDQKYSEDQFSPMTEYFFWPRKDAWEELKAALEAKPWVSERDKILMLNKTTEVINYWQDEVTKHSIEDARGKFTDCRFQGV